MTSAVACCFVTANKQKTRDHALVTAATQTGHWLCHFPPKASTSTHHALLTVCDTAIIHRRAKVEVRREGRTLARVFEFIAPSGVVLVGSACLGARSTKLAISCNLGQQVVVRRWRVSSPVCCNLSLAHACVTYHRSGSRAVCVGHSHSCAVVLAGAVHAHTATCSWPFNVTYCRC